jgi:hypothetical protein
MYRVYKLKFRSNAPYSFTASAGRNSFRIHIKHSIADDTYFMDIDMLKNNNYVPIIRCVSLTVAVDLFIPFARYGLGHFYVMPNDSRYYTEVPHSDTILSKFYILWEHE